MKWAEYSGIAIKQVGSISYRFYSNLKQLNAYLFVKFLNVREGCFWDSGFSYWGLTNSVIPA